MHPLAQLAKESVELYIRQEKIREIGKEELAPEFKDRAGVFVCLKVDGMLRGCIGTFQPKELTIAHETVRNAISAATSDPRFSCVRTEELKTIEYTVDVLTRPEPVREMNELDPRRYGVVVQADGRCGLLLPDLDGVDSADEQIRIAMQKAGIQPDAAVALFRFEVKRYR